MRKKYREFLPHTKNRVILPILLSLTIDFAKR